LGWRLLRRGKHFGMGYVIWPVSLVRYFEFPFTLKCLGSTTGEWLDVSSPHMFSFFQAQHCPSARITIINPDPQDIARTDRVLDAARFTTVQTHCAGADWIPASGRKFDGIWSISVIEHISGAYEDDRAVRMMYEALKPGGRLILTFPVDRSAWDEYV